MWRYACDADRLSPSEIAQAVLLAQNPPKKKKLTGREVCVTCITTGATYPSAQAAANEYGISAAGIIGACRGRYAYSGKHPQTGERLVWEYTEKTA